MITEIVVTKPKAKNTWEMLLNDPEVNECWDISNYTAVSKFYYNDQDDVHCRIAVKSALKMLKILLDNDITIDVVKEKAGYEDETYLIVLADALLYNFGITRREQKKVVTLLR